jgi:two-component system sensor histidine kinase/response regulator
MSSGYRNPSKAHIIAVDDSSDNLSLIECILDDPHYELDFAKSGKEALKKISRRMPDLILLDVMMPEMDGFEVTRRIRQDASLPYVPILLITAHDEVALEAALEAGADSFIRKPFDIDELQKHVEHFIQNNGEEKSPNACNLPV